MDTVGTITQVGWQGCFQGSLDDRSGFHHVLLELHVWSSFGFNWRGVDYVCTTLPFGWNERAFIYSTLSEEKAQNLHRQGIPALSYIDDSWMGTPLKSKHASDRNQRVEAAHALRFAVTVGFLCLSYLSSTKCELVPTQ